MNLFDSEAVKKYYLAIIDFVEGVNVPSKKKQQKIKN